MINLNHVKKVLQQRSKESVTQDAKNLQIAVYVMCGGGLLGISAAENPKDFYIDDRVRKLPFPKRQIKQAVKVLGIYAEVLDWKEMPKCGNFHNCGIF